MWKNCYMASSNLTDAYYTVPVAPHHRKYLQFMWRGKLFQYTCLPNGLSSASRYFTKPVYGILRSQGHLNVGYTDDSYLQGSSVLDRSQNILATNCLFENLGFVINKEKSVLQHVITLFSLVLYWTPHSWEYISCQIKHWDRVVSACQMLVSRGYVPIREVAQVTGLLVSSLPAVQYGHLFYRNIEIDKNEALHMNKGNFEALMQLSPESRKDLSWWVRNLPQAYKQIDLSNPDVELTTDASK